VAGVYVVPSGVAVERGKAQAFYAYWDAVGAVDRSIEWSISGQVSAGTYIANTGLLRVAADETAPTITVAAESAAHGVNASGVAYIFAGDSTALDLLLELKEDRAGKGVAGGYAPLGLDGKVPEACLPDADTKFLGIFATLSQLRAAYPNPEAGDYAFAGASPQTLYVWDGDSWEDTGSSGVPSGTFVERVNGRQGPNVSLGYGDVGAAAASHATDWAMHMTAAEKAKLSALEPNMTTVVTPSPATSSVRFAGVKVVKVGRLCFVLGEVGITSPLTKETTIIRDMPAAFAPDTDRFFYSYFPLSNSGSGNATFVGFAIKPDRSISIIGMDPGQMGVDAKPIPAGSWTHMNAIWLSKA
jgi:hypothetical protein